MPLPPGTVRGITYFPVEIEREMRARLREIDPIIADAPLGAILRYLAARAAGNDETQAIHYLYKQNRHTRKIPA